MARKLWHWYGLLLLNFSVIWISALIVYPVHQNLLSIHIDQIAKIHQNWFQARLTSACLIIKLEAGGAWVWLLLQGAGFALQQLLQQWAGDSALQKSKDPVSYNMSIYSQTQGPHNTQIITN